MAMMDEVGLLAVYDNEIKDAKTGSGMRDTKLHFVVRRWPVDGGVLDVEAGCRKFYGLGPTGRATFRGGHSVSVSVGGQLRTNYT
jgi:hypothetical protein